jgi:integrase
MARHHEVWWRASAGAWYVTWRGRQVRLTRGKGSRKEALEAFRKLATQEGGAQPPGESMPLGQLVALWLGDCVARASRGEMSPGTPADYRRRLGRLPQALGDVPASQLKVHQVQAWLDSQEGWGSTSRHDATGALKAMTRWAVAQGHLEADPLQGMRRPPRPARRELVMGPESWPQVRAAVLCPQFGDFLDFLWLTGARPGEARALEAAQVDWTRSMAVLTRAKTTRRTGRPRVIHLPAQALELTRRLAQAHPTGPLFLNSKGQPWTRTALNTQVRRLRARTGLGHDVVAYALRHIFATDALASGLSLATAAQLMGHSSPSLLGKVYSHLEDRGDVLQAALGKVRGPQP